MTDTEINIAIATACGWEFYRDVILRWHAVSPDGKDLHTTVRRTTVPGVTTDVEYHSKEAVCLEFCPNYVSDLNAMHEAEEVLFSTKHAMGCSVYLEWLLKLTADEAGQNTFSALRATARQKAEAFLRTLNLWKK